MNIKGRIEQLVAQAEALEKDIDEMFAAVNRGTPPTSRKNDPTEGLSLSGKVSVLRGIVQTTIVRYENLHKPYVPSKS